MNKEYFYSALYGSGGGFYYCSYLGIFSKFCFSIWTKYITVDIFVLQIIVLASFFFFYFFRAEKTFFFFFVITKLRRSWPCTPRTVLMYHACQQIYKSKMEFMNSFIIYRLTVIFGINKNNNFVIFFQDGLYLKNW